VSWVVTGAGGGIGRAVAEHLLAAEAQVVGQDLHPVDTPFPVVTGDVTDPAVQRELITRAAPAEQMQGAVLCHGVAAARRLEDTTPEWTRRVMAINFTSVVALGETLLANMPEGAPLVVISSQAGLVGEPSNGVYCASKSALLPWARALGSTGARVRVLCPGATETPLLTAALQGMADARHVPFQQVLSERQAATPLGRLGAPAEIAAAAVWLAQLRMPGTVVAAATGGEVLT
jgi:NAD(P)-dependent dehydrogenase (short-subunit alcohol dehydrogenase family)